MKTKLTGLLATLACAPCWALTANFDSATSAPDGYTEGGITFSHLGGFGLGTGLFGAQLYGGNYQRAGNSLYVGDNGWVGISAGGALMESVTFQGGFDWNFYSIEFGLLDVNFQWQTFAGGVLQDSGGSTWGRETKVHAFWGDINPLAAFDTVLVRATATEYAGVYAGPNNGWTYNRAGVIGWGDMNRIALDSVTVALLETPLARGSVARNAPDGGSAAMLLGCCMGVVAWMRRKLS